MSEVETSPGYCYSGFAWFSLRATEISVLKKGCISRGVGGSLGSFSGTRAGTVDGRKDSERETDRLTAGQGALAIQGSQL